MLTVAAIRERLADQIEAALASDPAGAWTRARTATPATFPVSSPEARDVLHHVFLVWPDSTAADPRDRQPIGRGVVSTHTLTVRWAHRLRADGADADIGEALESEALLLDALAGTPQNPGLRPSVVSIDRATTPDGLAFVGTVTLTVRSQPANPRLT